MPEAGLQRVTSVVLALYVGAFLGQALCVLHSSHMGAGMDGPPVAHASSPTMAPSLSMAVHGPSQHGERSGAPAESHSGTCAVIACASAITATADYGPSPASQVSSSVGVYPASTPPPESEMVPPPPRLG